MNVISLGIFCYILVVYCQTVNCSEKNTSRNETAVLGIEPYSRDRGNLPTTDPDKETVFRSLVKCPVEKSCVGRCTLNRDSHEKNDKITKCFCDPFCDTVYHDCCADYDKECNASSKKEITSKSELDDLWKCTKVDKNGLPIWTIAKCKPAWKNQAIAKKCTSPNRLEISTQIPVIDSNNRTFLNRYCAICNGIASYEFWNFKVKCSAKPAAGYTESESWKFMDYFCPIEFLRRESSSRARRHCFDVIQECARKPGINKKYKRTCGAGPTGLVSFGYKNYRNLDCYMCNFGLRGSPPTCGPNIENYQPMGKTKMPRSYSAIFTGSKSSFNSYSRCPATKIYDARLRVCRKLQASASIEDNSQEKLQKFAIILKYQDKKNDTCNDTFEVQTRFSYVFEKLLKVSILELNLETSDLYIQKQNNSRFTVTFQLLALREDLPKHSNETPLNYAKIQDLVFHASFKEGAQHGFCKYSLTKRVEREMICAQNATFVEAETSRIFPNGTLFHNHSQSYYDKGEFLKYNESFFVVCKEFKPANCTYYDVLHENTNDWTLFPNRSIYNHVTKSVFGYGEYSFINSKVWVCLKKDHLVKANIIQSPSTSTHKTVLSYITLISLSVSVLCLIAVIIIYSMNRSLRNIPGKNLMLLCGTLAVAQTLWLIEGSIRSFPALCTATAIGTHFAFLSSFCTSGSIAIHSLLTFRRLAKGRLYHSNKKRQFRWYSVYSVILPALWVTLCWVLDSLGVMPLRNETSNSCWLGDANGFKIAFLYPAAIQLFFNITTLVVTLRYIQKCGKASQQLQEKHETTNKGRVWIYLRMATLMGVSWLFGFFVVIFPNLVAFEYLFALGNGFQGFYIALAFLLTKNVKKIMAKRFTKISRSTTSTCQTSPSTINLYKLTQ